MIHCVDMRSKGPSCILAFRVPTDVVSRLDAMVEEAHRATGFRPPRTAVARALMIEAMERRRKKGSRK